MGIGNAGNQSCRDQWTNAGDRLKATAQFIRPVPGEDTPVSLEDLPLDQHELGPQRLQAFPRYRRYSLVGPFVDEPEQPLHAVTANTATIPNSAMWARNALTSIVR